jgi:hypothetical protein
MTAPGNNGGELGLRAAAAAFFLWSSAAARDREAGGCVVWSVGKSRGYQWRVMGRWGLVGGSAV